MFRTLARPTQELVPEDGTVSAALLPLDLETSKIDYETATFGLG